MGCSFLTIFFWTSFSSFGQHSMFLLLFLLAVRPLFFLGICMNGVYFWTAQHSLSLCLFALFLSGICMNGVCIEYGFIECTPRGNGAYTFHVCIARSVPCVQ